MWKKPVTIEPQNDQDKRRQALITANVMINDNRAKLKKPLDYHHHIANHTYLSYGYMGGAMAATLATCLAAGTHVPFLRSYASWISLLCGYYGGKMLHGVQNQYNLKQVVTMVDLQMGELEKMNQLYGPGTPMNVGEYEREMKQLKKMKLELQPESEESKQAKLEEVRQASTGIDDKVDRLIMEYEMKKKK